MGYHQSRVAPGVGTGKRAKLDKSMSKKRMTNHCEYLPALRHYLIVDYNQHASVYPFFPHGVADVPTTPPAASVVVDVCNDDVPADSAPLEMPPLPDCQCGSDVLALKQTCHELHKHDEWVYQRLQDTHRVLHETRTELAELKQTCHELYKHYERVYQRLQDTHHVLRETNMELAELKKTVHNLRQTVDYDSDATVPCTVSYSPDMPGGYKSPVSPPPLKRKRETVLSARQQQQRQQQQPITLSLLQQRQREDDERVAAALAAPVQQSAVSVDRCADCKGRVQGYMRVAPPRCLGCYILMKKIEADTDEPELHTTA